MGGAAAAGEFTTLHDTLVAILGVAVIGTLVNDGGIGVWQPATAVPPRRSGCLWAASLSRSQGGSDSVGTPAEGPLQGLGSADDRGVVEPWRASVPGSQERKCV